MLQGWQFWAFMIVLIGINIAIGAYVSSVLLLLGLAIIYSLPEHE